jgi:hypothetical protein
MPALERRRAVSKSEVPDCCLIFTQLSDEFEFCLLVIPESDALDRRRPSVWQ